jgi:hypothetical protein
LLADIKNGKNTKAEKFLKDYDKLTLDVISLAEARESIDNSKNLPNLDQQLRSQILTVLDFVSDSLAYMSPTRRS